MVGETKQDDPIIELTDVVEDGEDMEDILSDDTFSEDEIPDNSFDDNAIELTDMEEVSDIEMDIEDIESEDPIHDDRTEEMTVSQEQIEAALERVIEKKFAQKIEPLLFDTMERVILQEIQKIKTTLLKDMDRIDPF
jgi:beta-glucosidase-like glycosyl hydrolase